MKLIKKGTNLSKDIKNSKVSLKKEQFKSILTSIINIPIISGILTLLGYNDLIVKYSYVWLTCAILPNVITYVNKRRNKKKAIENINDVKNRLKEKEIFVSTPDIKKSEIKKERKGRTSITYYSLLDRKDKLLVLKEVKKELYLTKKYNRLYMLANKEEISEENDYSRSLTL